jgi:alpha-mannosidase
VIRAYDKSAVKEVLSHTGNVLTLYEDRPVASDAWDIDIFYEDQALETAQGEGHTFLGTGRVRQGIRFDLTIGQSTLTQKVYLDANSKRLDFVTDVEWQEHHRMLRVAFPTLIGKADVPLTVAGEGVALEVLKKAEKEECLIVRLVERLGCETTALVKLNGNGETLVETDLLEWNALDRLGGPTVEIPMKPFEIRTFKILHG